MNDLKENLVLSASNYIKSIKKSQLIQFPKPKINIKILWDSTFKDLYETIMHWFIYWGLCLIFKHSPIASFNLRTYNSCTVRKNSLIYCGYHPKHMLSLSALICWMYQLLPFSIQCCAYLKGTLARDFSF
jgi:hypothetical protein